MKYTTLVLGREGPLGFLTLNRPEQRNALNSQLLEDLHAAIDETEKDDELRVLIVSGNGEAFCAGADIGEIETFANPSTAMRFLHRAQSAFTRLEQLRVPVIAAVNGIALGGGCELALGCDFRIAAAGAKLGCPEIKLGLMPGGGGTQRLPRIVGLSRALEMICTGETVSAEEACRIGLVNRVVPAGALMDESKKMAERLTRRAPLALRMAKLACIGGSNVDMDTGLRLELQCMFSLYNSEDWRQAVKAFTEKGKG